MTPEEKASDLVRLVLSADTNREAEAPIAAAIAAAFAEGRLAGLEEGYEKALDDNGILHGEAARAFVAEMERPRSPEEVAKHTAFLAECDEVYRSSRAKSAGARECGICCRSFPSLPALLAHLTTKNACNAAMAEDALKAPKTPEIPAGKQG